MELLAVFPSGWLDFRVIAGDYSEHGLLQSRYQLWSRPGMRCIVMPEEF